MQYVPKANTCKVNWLIQQHLKIIKQGGWTVIDGVIVTNTSKPILREMFLNAKFIVQGLVGFIGFKNLKEHGSKFENVFEWVTHEEEILQYVGPKQFAKIKELSKSCINQ